MCVSVSRTLRHVLFFATPWMVARQAPLSMEFSRQEYWTLLPFTPPGDLPDPGIKPASSASPALQEHSLLLSHQGSPITMCRPYLDPDLADKLGVSVCVCACKCL